ncbi:MAG TPA: cupin domain-containing protein [Polyangiales bacterium]
MLDAQILIETLGLKPHPEGGFYVETFRAPLQIDSHAHPGPRNASTAIYFLLRRQDFSAFHRVRSSDELWHYYAGDPLELYLIDADSRLRIERLGLAFAEGERPQALAPRDVLQAAAVADGPHGFTLCGCTVAPGFDFADFELPPRGVLRAQHPAHASLFDRLCRA